MKGRQPMSGKVSERDKTFCRLRVQGLTNKQITTHPDLEGLQFASCTVKRSVDRVFRLYGPQRFEQEFGGELPSTSFAEVQAKAMVKSGDAPMDSLLLACKESGLPKTLLDALKKRIIGANVPQNRKQKTYTIDEFIEMLEDKAFRALEFTDEFSLSTASAKDLAFVVDKLLEKAQLLRGRPTQIIGAEERKDLNQLMPLLFEEAKRRAIDVEVIQ
jgi:hypothetical protein